MITKSYIEKNLKQIESLYKRSSSPKQWHYYSKLSLLELCGWIEVSMDDIVIRLSGRLLKNTRHHKYLKDDVVKRTYSFGYDKHFRKMLEAVIGLTGVEFMEMKVDRGRFELMVVTLDNLKSRRDDYAHNYIKGTTLNFDAPSVIKSYFCIIYDGLIDVNKVLQKIK